MSRKPDDASPDLSFAAEQMLAGARRWPGAGPGEKLGLNRWILGLLEHHRADAQAVDEEADLEPLEAAARRRLAAGDAGEPLSRDEVVAKAASRARAAGRPVIAPGDVAAAILDLAVDRLGAEGSPPETPDREAGGEDRAASVGERDETLASEPLPLSFAAQQLLGESETGDAGGALGRDEVAAEAGRRAREAGRSVVTPDDVTRAVQTLTEEREMEEPAPAATRTEPETFPAGPAEAGDGSAAVAEPSSIHDILKALGVAEPEEERGFRVTAGRARTFRLFVSSTFEDLTAERNALHAYVFPRLRELCREADCTFQAIDLRWGVSEQAGLDQQTMNICLREIERCHGVTPRPNFLVLLGDRYGWRPPPPQIPADEFKRLREHVTDEERALLCWEEKQPESERGWYRLDRNAHDPTEYRLRPREVDLSDCATREEEEAVREAERKTWREIEKKLHRALEGAAREASLAEDEAFKYRASATEQEIDAGALQVENPENKVFCFFREIERESFPDPFELDAFLEFTDRRREGRQEPLAEAARACLESLRSLGPEASARDVYESIEQAREDEGPSSDAADDLDWLESQLRQFTASGYRDLTEEDWSPDAEAQERLRSLKDRLRETVPDNVREYKARWTEAGPTTDHIGTLPADLAACLELLEEPDPPDTLCVRVWTRLARTILDEIVDPTEIPAPEEKIHVRADEKLDAEGRAHREFANGLLRFFVGRDEPRRKVRDYLEQGGSRVLALAARGGSGKSALMARALEDAQENHPDDAEIVYRFIGATPGSTDGRTLLGGLCREIARRYGADAEVSYDFNELAKELRDRLALATASRPLILFLDALDQLSHAHGARRLNWLPRGTELPDHVRMVVSTRREEKVRDEDEGFRLRPTDTYENLTRSQADEVPLDPMTRREGGELLADWLKDAGRELQDVQRDEVLDSFERSEGLPLYLKLAFEEARRWRSWDRLDELMPDGWEHDGVLAPGVEGIIRDNLFRRLAHERHHGQEMVSRTLGYLAASRYGLAEDEIVDLVSRDPELYASFLRASYHLPPDLLTRTAVYLRGPDASQMPGESVAEVTPDEIAAAEQRLKELREAKRGENGTSAAEADAEGSEEDELVSLLAKILPSGPRLPIVLWSRLYYDLEPYLTERQAETASLLDFYHWELGEVASDAYLADGRGRELHGRMADYFRDRADPGNEGSWEAGDIRGLSELPYHLTEAARWDDVFETLTDFRFLEHKAAEVGVVKPPEGEGETVYTGVYELQQDYELALAEMPGGEGAGADRRPLIVTATDFGDGLVVRCPWCNTAHPLPEDKKEREEWIGKERPCANEECGGPLKVNSFVCERPSWVGRG